jgi:hypothetical protein
MHVIAVDYGSPLINASALPTGPVYTGFIQRCVQQLASARDCVALDSIKGLGMQPAFETHMLRSIVRVEHLRSVVGKPRRGARSCTRGNAGLGRDKGRLGTRDGALRGATV